MLIRYFYGLDIEEIDQDEPKIYTDLGEIKKVVNELNKHHKIHPDYRIFKLTVVDLTEEELL